MNALDTKCPSESVLSDFGLGKLDAGSAETVSRHIETCADCRRRVAGVTGDSFVGRLKQAGNVAQPVRERTYVPGESLANAANSTDGSLEDGLPRPSRTDDGRGRPSHVLDGLGSPSSVSAPPELANHPDYELIKELGQGGMGTVYLAKNRMMDRMEVLKVISKALLDRPGALERFQQEIRSAAKLAHPNIVAAYTVLRPGDLLVFAMEYVKGQDLSQVVKGRGYLPVANAAFYIHQVALGLQHAHEKGMVHRDIKPNNLMLAIEGKKHVVKILDFGLAKATSEKGAESGLTKSGQMLGTPDYVAPEQTLDAHNADIRADIYSLGCTLYFLLSGNPPFQETSLFEILKAHHERDPKPLNLIRPDVPVELAAVIGKMMAKDPAKRYQTPGEVAKALVPFFKPGQGVATSPLADAMQTQTAVETQDGLGGVILAPPIAPPPTPFPQPMMAAIQPAATPTIVVARKPLKSPKRPGPSWIAIAAGAAFVALLLGVIVIIRNDKGDEVARVDVPEGASVEIKPTETNSPKTPDGPKNASASTPSESAPVKSATQPAIGASGPSNAGANAETASADTPSTSGAPPLAVAPFDAKQARAHQEAWAKHLGIPVERTNSIGMKFVLIPPGDFTMGSTPAEIEEALKPARNDKHWQDCIKSEAPAHKVVLTQPFYIAVHEATQKEYEAVMGNNPSYFAKTGPDANVAEQFADIDTANHPVERVSWNDAAEFCAKLSRQEDLKPFYFRAGEAVTPLKGTGYRLPTEAEWEFVCRAGTTTRFWIGDNDHELTAAGWFERNSGLRTHEAEELLSNPFGLFDVHGNVWEWVEDGWEPTHSERFADKAAIDPKYPPSAGRERLLRGGNFNYPASCCRSSARIAAVAESRLDRVGFRVALVAAGLRASAPKPSESATVNSATERAIGASTPTDAGAKGETASADSSSTGGAPPLAVAPFDAKQARAQQDTAAPPVEGTAKNDTTTNARKLTATEAFSLRQHTAAVTRVAFHRGRPLLVSAGKDGHVLLWNLADRTPQSTLYTYPHTEIWAVKFSPDGQAVAHTSRFRNGSKVYFKTLSGQVLKAISDFNKGGAVDSIAYSPDGRLFAAGQDDGGIRLWDLAQFQEIAPVSFGPGQNIHRLAFGQITSGRKNETEYLLAAGGKGGVVRTLTATLVKRKNAAQWTFAPTDVQFAKGAPVWGVRFSANGELLGFSREDGNVCLCDPRTGATVRDLAPGAPGKHNVDWIAFHPLRPWCVTAHKTDQAARIWNTETAELLCELKGHTGGVLCAEFSPDGRQVATASEDFSIKLWDLSGAEVPAAKESKKAKLAALTVGD